MNKDLDYIFPDPPEGVDPRALDPERIPESVAIIMDGNGRWAKKRALNRLKGHKAGIEAVREAIRCASDLGVRYLTIYSFSTENWKRPEDEVVGLMAQRLSNREIAEKLFLTEGSVKQYIKQIYSKLHIEGDTRTKRGRLSELLETKT